MLLHYADLCRSVLLALVEFCCRAGRNQLINQAGKDPSPKCSMGAKSWSQIGCRNPRLLRHLQTWMLYTDDCTYDVPQYSSILHMIANEQNLLWFASTVPRQLPWRSFPQHKINPHSIKFAIVPSRNLLCVFFPLRLRVPCPGPSSPKYRRVGRGDIHGKFPFGPSLSKVSSIAIAMPLHSIALVRTSAEHKRVASALLTICLCQKDPQSVNRLG